MSEQTPDASGGMADSHEPSMEDILASIRKIIADDDSAVEPEATVPGFTDLTPDLVIENAPEDTLDLEILADSQDMDIPDIHSAIPATPESTGSAPVSDIELLLSDVEEIADAPVSDEAPVSDLDVLDLDIAMDEESETADDEVFDDVLSLLEDDLAEVTSTEVEEPQVSEKQDDLSLMLDDMLTDETPEDEIIVEETVIDPAAELLETDAGDDDMTSSGDADIDLVKSLMADLTEEPLHDETELDIPDINAALEAENDDVMDEILSMTLDDEAQLQEETARDDAATQDAQIGDDTPTSDNPLLAIAAEVSADAASADTEGLSVMPTPAVGAALLSGAVVAASQPKDDVDEAIDKLDALIEEDESPETALEIPEPEPIPEETPTMPRAAKETIIDEVTETATADVFSSLNKVVEEKATVAERGDRIGDLVMEALRPMLKEWLDANLKGIVERAVTKEVKRISSGK